MRTNEITAMIVAVAVIAGLLIVVNVQKRQGELLGLVEQAVNCFDPEGEDITQAAGTVQIQGSPNLPSATILGMSFNGLQLKSPNSVTITYRASHIPNVFRRGNYLQDRRTITILDDVGTPLVQATQGGQQGVGGPSGGGTIGAGGGGITPPAPPSPGPLGPGSGIGEMGITPPSPPSGPSGPGSGSDVRPQEEPPPPGPRPTPPTPPPSSVSPVPSFGLPGTVSPQDPPPGEFWEWKNAGGTRGGADGFCEKKKVAVLDVQKNVPYTWPVSIHLTLNSDPQILQDLGITSLPATFTRGRFTFEVGPGGGLYLKKITGKADTGVAVP